MMNKKCIHCGAELPEAASFCPHCAKSQTEKQPVTTPREKHTRAIALMAAAALAVIAVVLIITHIHAPKVYEGTESLTYTANDTSYQLLLSFSGNPAAAKKGVTTREVTIADGMESSLPSQLYVFDSESGEYAWEQFLELVDSCRVEVEPLEGASAMDFNQASHSDFFANAAYEADIVYDSTCGTNKINWTLNMKNGDTLHLTHSIAVAREDAVTYYADEIPMGTSEELQTLLDTIEAEVDPATSVYLYLPAVTYDSAVTFGNHTFTIYGGVNDDGTMTTFAGEVAFKGTDGHHAVLYDLNFTHDGTGTGLTAYEYVLVDNCSFTGWEIGALAQNGGWVSLISCTLENNGVGLKFNSQSSSGANPTYNGNTFKDNGTAVLLASVPALDAFDFTDSIFSGNDTNIDNICGQALNTVNAVFE